MPGTDADTDADGGPAPIEGDPVARLEAAVEARESAESDVAEYGEETLERVREARRDAERILTRYGDDVTGTGEFGEYLQFQGEVATLVEDLPEDLPRREAFEAFSDAVHRRQIREKDLERGKRALERAEDLVDLLEDLEDARERVREARRAVRDRREALTDRIAALERVQSFADVDFDAPVEALRDPVTAYNEAVREAFVTYRREASARDALATLDAAARAPLVPLEPPPADLRSYVEAHPVGEESLTTLWEYADYSPSKLDHYVEDAEAFRRRVGANVAYLEALDADPLTVSWPPPPAERLRWRLDELVGVVDRFAGETTVARLHDLRELARSERYGTLREAAVARDELDAEQRDRLRRGAVADDLAAAREELERVEAALAEHD